MKEFFYIYQITNLINGKIYVGAHATSNLNDGYMGSGKLLLRAYRKYGKENFKKEILPSCSCIEELYQKEAEIVNTPFVQRKDTYNLTEGRRGGSPTACRNGGKKAFKLKLGVFSKEGKEKQRVGYYHPKRLERLRQRNAGFFNTELQKEAGLKAHSKEAVEKRTATFKKMHHSQGTHNTQFGTMWIHNNQINLKIAKDAEIPPGFRKGRKMSLHL